MLSPPAVEARNKKTNASFCLLWIKGAEDSIHHHHGQNILHKCHHSLHTCAHGLFLPVTIREGVLPKAAEMPCALFVWYS